MIKNTCNVTYLLLSIVLIINSFDSVLASRTSSRNFSNLEYGFDFVVKKDHRYQIRPSFFMTSATSALSRNEDDGGCSPIELWGKYDFRQLIQAKNIYDGNTTDPLSGDSAFTGRDKLMYRVDSEIKTAGIMIASDLRLGNCTIKNARWSIGASVPIISAQTFVKYTFNKDASDMTSITDDNVALLDTRRRKFHQDIGLAGNTWNKVCFGDLDFHLGWTYERDHCLKMRNVILQNSLGILTPLYDGSNPYYPSSVALYGTGHFGIYNDLFMEFELKTNWKLGFLLSGLWQFGRRRNERVSVYKEPCPFSPLVTPIYVKPGFTFKFAPSFTLENIMDGVNARGTYTYLRHGEDVWEQNSYTESTRSYLNRKVTTAIAPTDIIDNINNKQFMSSWRGHFLSLDIVYDSNQTLNHWNYDPVFFITYDYPLGGVGAARAHELKLGIRLRF